MAPNSDIIRVSPTPAFTARMLALPVLNQAVNRAIDAFDTGRNRNDAMGAALRAAEASMRVAASGALPLATPIVNTVGGWGVIDEWACRGLDRVEKVAPIIKKPTDEIVTTTRQSMLKAVAGGTGPIPSSFTEAFTVRANNAVDFVVNTRGGKVVIDTADQALVSAHTFLDTYLPPERGDRQGTGAPKGGINIKVASLYNKAQQRLYRSVYILIRPPNDRSIDGLITFALLIDFGRRTAVDIYAELLREPRQGETQSMGMAMARSTAKLTKQFTDQMWDIIQKQMDSLKAMDREAFMKILQNMLKSSTDMTSNAGVFMQGATSAVVKAVGNVLENGAQYRKYLENMLRRAMTDYENRERAARAAAAAANFRQKNQMERVVSPPPPISPPSGARFKAPLLSKKK